MATNEEIVDLLLLPKNKGMLDLLILAESGRGIEREVLARNTGRVFASFALGSPLPAIDIRGAQGLTEDQIHAHMTANTELKQNIAKQKADLLSTLEADNKDLYAKQAEIEKQFYSAFETALTQAATNDRESGKIRSENERAMLNQGMAAIEIRQGINDNYSMSGATDAGNAAYNQIRNGFADSFNGDEDLTANSALEILKTALSTYSDETTDEDLQRILFNVNDLAIKNGLEGGVVDLIKNRDAGFFGSLDATIQAQIDSMVPAIAEQTKTMDILNDSIELLMPDEKLRGGVSTEQFIRDTFGVFAELGLITVGEDGKVSFDNSSFDPSILDNDEIVQQINEYFVPAENQIDANIMAIMSTGQGQKTFREVMVNVVLGDEQYQEVAAQAAKLPRIFGRKKDDSEGVATDDESPEDYRRVAGQKRAQSRVLKAGRQIGKGKFEQKTGEDGKVIQSMTPGEAYAARQQARLKRRKGEVLVESDAQRAAKAAQEKALKEGALGAVQNMGAPQRYAPPAPDSGSKYNLGTDFEKKRKERLKRTRDISNKAILAALGQAGGTN